MTRYFCPRCRGRASPISFGALSLCSPCRTELFAEGGAPVVPPCIDLLDMHLVTGLLENWWKEIQTCRKVIVDLNDQLEDMQKTNPDASAAISKMIETIKRPIRNTLRAQRSIDL